jgi:hypothetical protein
VKVSELLEPRELRKVFKRIRDARGDDRDIRGKFHLRREEIATYPLDRPFPENHERKPHQKKWLLTPIRTQPGPLQGLRNPSRRFRLSSAQLGLPELPSCHTFCYYATEEWVFDMLSNGPPAPVVMSPLTRAAMLGRLEIFYRHCRVVSRFRSTRGQVIRFDETLYP